MVMNLVQRLEAEMKKFVTERVPGILCYEFIAGDRPEDNGEGAVYAVAVELDEPQFNDLITEAQGLKTIQRGITPAACRLPCGLVCLYLGSDRTPPARLVSHSRTDPAGTGSLYLGRFKSLAGRRIAAVVIPVADREASELALLKGFPGLLKTTKRK